MPDAGGDRRHAAVPVLGREPGSVGPEETGGRHGGLIRLLASVTSHGVGWAFLALAAVMGWFAIQMIWRFAEHVAITADADGLRLHGLFGGRVQWADVAGIAVETRGRQRGIAIRLHRPYRGQFSVTPARSIWIGGVDVDNGAGDAFVQAARQLHAGPGASDDVKPAR